MSFAYVKTKKASESAGIRMTVVSGVPSPWSEAAKSFLYLKGLDWSAVRLDPSDERQKQWMGGESAPALRIFDEPPISAWDEILTRIDRFETGPKLVPEHAEENAWEMSREICGHEGLGWMRRLQLMHSGFQKRGGFSVPVASYHAEKYGYEQNLAESANAFVSKSLGQLADVLRDQRQKDSCYYLGGNISCVDVYSATIAALFQPLPNEICEMNTTTRAAFEFQGDVENSDDLEVILEHRDYVYREYLDIPLKL